MTLKNDNDSNYVFNTNISRLRKLLKVYMQSPQGNCTIGTTAGVQLMLILLHVQLR